MVLVYMMMGILINLDKNRGVPVSNRGFLKELDVNHKIKVESGLLDDESSSMLKNFFIERRAK